MKTKAPKISRYTPEELRHEAKLAIKRYGQDHGGRTKFIGWELGLGSHTFLTAKGELEGKPFIVHIAI